MAPRMAARSLRVGQRGRERDGGDHDGEREPVHCGPHNWQFRPDPGCLIDLAQTDGGKPRCDRSPVAPVTGLTYRRPIIRAGTRSSSCSECLLARCLSASRTRGISACRHRILAGDNPAPRLQGDNRLMKAVTSASLPAGRVPTGICTTYGPPFSLLVESIYRCHDRLVFC